ncbi:MOSC domain-containing protein [Xylariaceae sp. FL0594]|nr:MOSC domain-containing protein [Xylariaceae sp. FL0594]
MKITELYIYPIKSLAPISVPRAVLRPEGVEHDRRFMLLKVLPDGRYKNIQIVHFPECALFHQRLIDAGEEDVNQEEEMKKMQMIEVTYHIPSPPLFEPVVTEQRTALHVPLYPEIDKDDENKAVGISLMDSPAIAYRMGDPYDKWFSACFGYPVILVYIGDSARDVLAHKPSEHPLWRNYYQSPSQQEKGTGWMSTIASYIPGIFSNSGDQKQRQEKEKKTGRGSEWLAFNEIAPYLVTSKASLRDVSRRLPDGEEMDMRRFRPNIVVDGVSGEGGGKGGEEEEEQEEVLEAWDEDFWAELTVVRKWQESVDGEKRRGQYQRHHRLALTSNCGRCMSINVDYHQGRPSEGEAGRVLKKLMADRRVDPGNKYSPIFGRYAFIAPPNEGDDEEHVGVIEVAVGDEIHVTKRLDQRDTWAWPRKAKKHGGSATFTNDCADR